MKSTLRSNHKKNIIEWLDTLDRLMPEKRRTRLQEWILDFAERELFVVVWTFIFSSVFGSGTYIILGWLYGETYATLGLLALVSLILTMLFIFVFFPKSETEEKISQILDIMQDDLLEDVAMIKRNV